MAEDLQGDPAAGAEVFEQCSGCHEVGQDAEHGIGPHLNALFGRPAAGLEDFSYSRSLQRAGAGGLEWHVETLDVFLENPQALATGTRMSFGGLEDPAERRNLIAYLRDFSGDPSSLPPRDRTVQTTNHDLDPEILALQGDPAYGQYLSGECTTCHQAAGGDDGIPSIVLWPETDFVVAMHAYKNKQRNHPVMQMVAGRLGNEEIAALAAYFATLGN
jgi:cytochrome c